MFIFYALFYLSDSLNNKHVSFTFLPSPVLFTGTSRLLNKRAVGLLLRAVLSGLFS